MSQTQSKALVKLAALPNVSTGSGDQTALCSVGNWILSWR